MLCQSSIAVTLFEAFCDRHGLRGRIYDYFMQDSSTVHTVKYLSNINHVLNKAFEN
jgi:hypothetical protein